MSRRSIYEVVGRNIQALRKQRGMTQAELAQRAFVDRSYLARLEKGKANPSIKVLFYIAKALSVRVRELVKIGRGKKKLISPLHF